MTDKKKIIFDVAIGNPPYQEETTEEEATQNKQKPVKNIFQLFQEGADGVSNTTVLIYPGGEMDTSIWEGAEAIRPRPNQRQTSRRPVFLSRRE